MIKFKDISIPKPCSIDYDAWPGDEVKRLCGRCEKHVYDFRAKDEAYLNEVFRATEKVCGIYYADQIQSPTSKIQRTYFYALTAKIIGILLFIKTLLSSFDTEATKPNTYPIIQLINDSSKVNTIYKGRDNGTSIDDITIECYVNDTLFKTYYLSYKETLYLPNSLHPNDKIKLIVSTTRRNIVIQKKGTRHKASYYSTNTKRYNFIFKEIHSISIKINYNKKIFLSSKKRTAVTGLICPANFW
ncbi:hypothetical protein [uncultured Cytophaga sp.]|uniref:hypothetical protein n=1 Tax=uncultured Cytophaga sp. TaxID=160238 RepID=UPI00263297B5|nr:hypothetical protein [uncultured Cytophaga sp.]